MGLSQFIIGSIVILLLSCNIYLNKDKLLNLYPKDFSKDTFKLYYFKVNGRAAPARAILSYAKVNFEENFVGPNWQEQKKNKDLFEFGQVPILVHNGKTMSQSKAIYLYLAQLFGLDGKNIDDQYQIHSLLNSYDDISRSYGPYAYPKSDEEKNNKEKYKKILVEELKRIFGIYEKRYIKLGTGKYYLGDYFSLADIYLTIYMNVFTKNVGGFQLVKESAPKLADLITRIKKGELKTFFEKYYYD